MHQDGGKVSAVAADIKESTCAIAEGSGKPLMPLGTNTNLLWTFVSIVHDNLPHIAELAIGCEAQGLGVGGVPGRLIVDEDMHVITFCRIPDGERIGYGGRKGFLN